MLAEAEAPTAAAAAVVADDAVNVLGDDGDLGPETQAVAYDKFAVAKPPEPTTLDWPDTSDVPVCANAPTEDDAPIAAAITTAMTDFVLLLSVSMVCTSLLRGVSAYAHLAPYAAKKLGEQVAG